MGLIRIIIVAQIKSIRRLFCLKIANKTVNWQQIKFLLEDPILESNNNLNAKVQLYQSDRLYQKQAVAHGVNFVSCWCFSCEENLNFLPEEPLVFTRNLRNGRDFDTLLGRSFGTNKRDSRRKRNFDEIDNAGFKDYLYKRNLDEMMSAGFRNNLERRNFDEIDNAGFRDNLKKRNFDEIDNSGFQDYLYKRNFDEIDNAGFTDYLSKRNPYGWRNSSQRETPSELYHALLKEFSKSCRTDNCKKKLYNFLSIYKRNFDEIDNAGFRDYLYKRTFPPVQNSMSATSA